jgi:hypothetical protein
MSARTFMTCELFEQAEDLDHYVCDSLRERDGNMGSCWSGVWTNGEVYGIVWAAPASGLFGQPVSEDNPGGDPLVKLATETFTDGPDGPVSNWSLVVPEVVVDPEAI